MDLISKFKAYNTEQKLFQPSDKILIACSGGKDSMTLVHIFRELHLNIGLAYFDHVTRNGKSKEDGLFVEAYAKRHNIPYYSESVDIFKFIDDSKENSSNNFQEVARNFRYSFFNKIMLEHHYDLLATAHHKNDSIETFIFNLSRSAGPEGLTGIKNKLNNIIRPLMTFSVDEILEYVEENNVVFREDSSNSEVKYIRNKIRHIVIPALISFDHQFVNSAFRSMEFIKLQNEFVHKEVQQWLAQNSETKNGILKISLTALFQHHSYVFLLFQILKPYGFNKNQVTSILGASQKGKKIVTNDYICFNENEYLSLKKITQNDNIVSTSKNLEISANKPSGEYHLIKNSITVDQLEIRTWKPGDYMKFQYGKKKLKKIFNEKGVGNAQKDQFELIAFGNEILWIIGLIKSNAPKINANYLYFT